jgi:hypothetical protein
MQHAGFKWSVSRDGDQWRWKAVNRDDQTVFVQGLADSRPEAAAYLVRAMAMGVISDETRVPA